MATTKDTKRFLDWLETELKGGWFAYEHVDVIANTFMIRYKDDGDVYAVWSHGKLKFKGRDGVQAMVTFEKERQRHGKRIG